MEVVGGAAGSNRLWWSGNVNSRFDTDTRKRRAMRPLSSCHLGVLFLMLPGPKSMRTRRSPQMSYSPNKGVMRQERIELPTLGL